MSFIRVFYFCERDIIEGIFTGKRITKNSKINTLHFTLYII